MNKEIKKYHNEVCNNKMSYRECELAILRQAVDESENIQKKKMANSENVESIIKVVEEFLKRKKLVCYGGTAINNILPPDAQFYDRDIEIPDYDFYSPNALEDAVELANIYYKLGYNFFDSLFKFFFFFICFRFSWYCLK